ncbi:MAG: YceI family protein, partial [Myxococcales bacterium]|nr:YceI family protein [Myxococcales bacterium]
HIAEDVLHAQQFPEVSFSSSEVEEVDGGFRVQGSLNLHGQVGTIGADIRSDGGRWTTEVSIDQRDYGIRPFRALFGLIRIKPVVRVRVSVPQVARE